VIGNPSAFWEEFELLRRILDNPNECLIYRILGKGTRWDYKRTGGFSNDIGQKSAGSG
jgi:hypothetical protein